MSTMTDNMTGQEWLDRYGVSFDWSADGFHQDRDGWEHQRFTLLLSDGTGTLTIPWRQGLGVEDDPTPESTLPAVRMDVEHGGKTWSEFAGEFGYDEFDAPLSEYRSWEACRDMRAELEEFCAGAGADMFPDFLRIEEVDADTEE